MQRSAVSPAWPDQAKFNGYRFWLFILIFGTAYHAIIEWEIFCSMSSVSAPMEVGHVCVKLLMFIFVYSSEFFFVVDHFCKVNKSLFCKTGLGGEKV